ncbi:MAG TPA: FAD-dependent oxidoreductase [Chloroflexia bacterium]|nr:FAD-dependent oxidoreductase [Chloroflexia bacterium]
MAQPVIFLVENDREILQTMVEDLRRRYGARYNVASASSGAEALSVLHRLQRRDEPVALLLVERHLRQGVRSGADFLEQATAFAPEAKRILFTSSLDKGTVRISDVLKIDYTLPGGRATPQEYLYPVLDDLLADWHAPSVKRPVGIRVVGYRWSPHAHAIRDFLTRNEVAYEWVDAEEDPRAKELTTSTTGETRNLPVVLLPKGSILEDPPIARLAEHLGLQTHTARPFYDLIVVGGGPAGLAAGIYAASEGLRVVIIERETPGGQASHSALIANYLGFPAGVPGPELAARAVAQASHFEAELVAPLEATGLRIDGNRRIVTLSDGSERGCYALLIAIGVSWRKLEVPEIERLTGAGVYYGGALSEARFCENEDVYIVGGANSAGQSAVHFSRYARKVVLLVRGNSLSESMSQYLIDEIEQAENIEVLLNTQVKEVHGERRLEAITIENSVTGERQTVPTNWLFIFIGTEPRTGWLKGVLQLAEDGSILTARDLPREGERPPDWALDREPFLLETSVPGVFAAGDVRHDAVKRVAAAVGNGAMAIQFIHRYLSTI